MDTRLGLTGLLITPMVMMVAKEGMEETHSPGAMEAVERVGITVILVV